MLTDRKPIKILHVTGGLHMGGAEKWTVDAACLLINQHRISVGFLVHDREKNHFFDQVTAAGSKIHILKRDNLFRYILSLKKLIRAEGYEIVHSHLNLFGSIIALAAKLAGCKVIAHAHSDLHLAAYNSGSLFRRAYFLVSRMLLKVLSDGGIGVSTNALTSMFGPNADLKELFRVIYCGIDLDLYTTGQKKHTLTVGQIGRLVDVKNHRFSLSVIHAVKQRCPNVVFEIVGDGENKGKLRSLAEDLMISKHVRFLGLRSDIPSVLQHMDILILPSLYEGLPVVAVESQAAGVPIIVSEQVTDEACISASHFVKLPLASPVAWADKIIELYESAPVPVDKNQFTRFHLKKTSQELYDLYREVLDRTK